VLVGPGDDAGVCLVDGRAIVETVDVMSPVVNDPFTFGEISAANSLSDVYAMGGSPVSAMAVAGFPLCDYEPAVLGDIMKGALATLDRAGVALVGGHSFDNGDIKFGLSVMGTVDKDRILRVSGAKPGELLVLTKPLGVGILTTALKGGILTDAELQEAIGWMKTLNREASEIALKAGVSACTDVTGFGLLGHALNMLKEGRADFSIAGSDIPLMGRVTDMIDEGMAPGGAYRNLSFAGGFVDWGEGMTEEMKLILSDPQTSGGLLVSVRKEGLGRFEESGLFYRVIGNVIEGTGRISVS
jgi:selenide,water dikinase